MVRLKVNATWKGGNRFIAEADGLGPVTMEWGKGKANFGPMDILLAALAGCTGIDIVDILTKMKERISTVDVSVDGHRREEYPQIYDRIDVKYVVYGQNISREKAERAVELSVEKYCSVSAMLDEKVKLTHSLDIHESAAE